MFSCMQCWYTCNICIYSHVYIHQHYKMIIMSTWWKHFPGPACIEMYSIEEMACSSAWWEMCVLFVLSKELFSCSWTCSLLSSLWSGSWLLYPCSTFMGLLDQGTQEEGESMGHQNLCGPWLTFALSPLTIVTPLSVLIIFLSLSCFSSLFFYSSHILCLWSLMLVMTACLSVITKTFLLDYHFCNWLVWNEWFCMHCRRFTPWSKT